MSPIKPLFSVYLPLGFQIVSDCPAGFAGPEGFEKGESGKIAEDFQSHAGRWEVVQDEKNRVFARRASTPTTH